LGVTLLIIFTVFTYIQQKKSNDKDASVTENSDESS
jgi:hypothetical protein